jgi:DNA polymerase-3 subunit gamma/tau
MGKALYRQYRSTSFDEVIGQEHITTTLKNSLESGTIAHAYLLTGPRGVGKTSIARILAHAVNDLKYEKDGGINLDIIEIDAASNRRIDEIRDLREKVHIAPTSAKYKVYIIDEVHMLTREAFNALLKTLEEPPEHVIFVLATTEIHKLPDTIISRCISFNFRPIDTASMVQHLKYIAKKEKLDIDDEALELLAIHGDGSFRDSISLLDQVKNIGKKITRQEIELTLGLAPEKLVEDIFQAIVERNPKALNSKLEEAYRHGASELNLARQISEHTRGLLLNQSLPFPPQQATDLLKELLDVPGSPKPRASLEVCLLSQIFKDNNQPQKVVQATVSTETKTEDPPAPATQKKEPAKLKPKETKKSVPATSDSESWEEILQKLKQRNNTLYSIARMAQADMQASKLILNFKFPFHAKQFNNSKNKAILTSIIEESGRKNLEIEVNLQTTEKKAVKREESLESINNIFGSSEVIES